MVCECLKTILYDISTIRGGTWMSQQNIQSFSFLSQTYQWKIDHVNGFDFSFLFAKCTNFIPNSKYLKKQCFLSNCVITLHRYVCCCCCQGCLCKLHKLIKEDGKWNFKFKITSFTLKMECLAVVKFHIYVPR